jgi:hypothetical protein
MRNRHKKSVKVLTLFQQRLAYLGFETEPCERCSSKQFLGYHRKGTSGNHKRIGR